MLLIMFGAIIAIFLAFFNYNISANEQMNIEHERSQEKIEITQLDVNDEFQITSLRINNTGTIEVRIRALYQITSGETRLIFDPASYADTHIAPTASLLIYIPQNIPQITFDPEAKIIAATERGTKTLDYVPTLLYGPIEPPSEYDPTKLYIGPLMLKFDDFNWHKVDSNGNLDPADTWHPGWVVPKGQGSLRYAWKISVMNIDQRNITLNMFSSFNLSPVESPSILSWYINPTNQITNTQFLPVNQTQSVTFIWDGPISGSAQKMFTNEGTCMVFLTFFGIFHEADGTETPYAQTIPFEASVTIS